MIEKDEISGELHESVSSGDAESHWQDVEVGEAEDKSNGYIMDEWIIGCNLPWKYFKYEHIT